MSRLVVIVLVAIGVVVCGWSAVWLYNRSTAEQQVAQALATLEQAGVPNSYDAIGVSGFPFSYRGEVTNLKIGEGDAALTFPAVAAEVGVGALDTVLFDLPETIGLGDAELRTEGLQAAVTRADERSYDLKITADRVFLTPPEGEGSGEVTASNVAADGAFNVSPDQSEVTLRFAVTADAATIDTLEASEGPDPVKVELEALNAALEGDLKELAAVTSVGRATFEGPDGSGVGEVRDYALTASITAKDQFDPAPLLGVTDLSKALEAFWSMATQSISEGGAAVGRLQIAALQASALDLSGGEDNAPGGAGKVDLQNLTIGFDFGPERMRFTTKGDKMLVDVAAEEADASLYYDLADVEYEMSATAAEAFDFSLVDFNDPEAFGEQLVAAFSEQLLQGGAVEVLSRSGPTVFRGGAADLVPDAPPSLFESTTGPSEFRFAMNPDELVLKLDADEIVYSASGALEGEAALQALTIDFQSPLRASEEPQMATLSAEVGEVTLSDEIWALVDPEAALVRDVKGLRVGANAELNIIRDVLSPDADLINLANPAVLPGTITVQDTSLDLLGLQADLTGAFSAFPLPEGEFDLNLKGWRGFLDAVQRTTLAADPSTISSLLMMNDDVAYYGRPIDPNAPETDAVTFKIELGSAGLLVNGEPYEPGGPSDPVAPPSDGAAPERVPAE
ncbi:MAG: DUF2125 domain-containing protein [Pseudomonadota bacterium]